MNIKSKNTLLSAIVMFTALVMGAQTANSQQRQLPAAHKAQHAQLLANQRPIVSGAAAVISKKTVDEVARREALDEIYNTCWNSQSVNPYGNTPVPATKEINVAEGVVPVKGPLTSKYGWRAQFGRMHRGVDLSLRVGDTVRVAFSGKVRLCKYEAGGYGNYVVVRHDNGMETVYGHLSKSLVKPNQEVKAGDPIALGGNTGRSTGPHLHFETRYMGLAVNPELIFDFTHKTTIKDTYTFNKAAYQKAQVNGPRKSTEAKESTATTANSKSVSSSKATSKRTSSKSKRK